MADEATLAAGTVVEYATDLDTPVYVELLGVMSFGALGEMAEPKESTTLKDTNKKYGAGMKDAPDKAIKFQMWALDADQKAFVAAAIATDTLLVKVTSPAPVGASTGKIAIMEWKLLGFESDDVTGEDWQMGTINAKQNSIDWTDAVAA